MTLAGEASSRKTTKKPEEKQKLLKKLTGLYNGHATTTAEHYV